MNNKCLVFSIVENLVLEENTSFSLLGCRITNNFEEIMSIIPNLQYFGKEIGNIIISSFTNKTFIYRICNLGSGENQVNILHQEALSFNARLSLSWLFKDNAVFSSMIFSQKYDNFSVEFSYLDKIISRATGCFDSFLLNKNSISNIDEKNLLKYISVLYKIKENNENNIVSEERIKGTEIKDYFIAYNRIQRAYLLLQISRETSFLPMKIGFYINVLECLLLKSESELNFRLQLYVAHFIGNNKDETMNIVKSAYNVRSKFFHGSGIKNTTQELQNISEKLDEIVRKTFNKAIDNNEIINDDKKLDNYFKSLLFS